MRNFLIRNKKQVISFLVLAVLVAALPLGINIMRQQQIINSRAALDPIVFTGGNVVSKNGQWVALKPQIQLQLTSRFGTARQFGASVGGPISEKPIMSRISEGLVKTAYATVTCQNNPESPPAGDLWKANCGGSACNNNSNCPQNNWDTANINQANSNWCYGFDGPNKNSSDWRCLMLVRVGCESPGAAGCNPQSPTCSVGNMTFSPSNPAANATVKVTVGAGNQNTWNYVAYKVDNGAWINTGITVNQNGPSFTFNVSAGANGQHSVTFGNDYANGTAKACIGSNPGTFTTGTPGPTATPAACSITCHELTKCDPTCDSTAGKYCSADYRTCPNGTTQKTFNACEAATGPKVCASTPPASSPPRTNPPATNPPNRTNPPRTNPPNRTNPPATNPPNRTNPPRPTATPSVYTTQFRVADSAIALSTASWQAYTSDAMAYNFEFKDITPGVKTIFAEFKDSSSPPKTGGCGANNSQPCSIQIRLAGTGPKITGCSINTEGSNIVFSLTGTNFGSVNGTAASGQNPLQIRNWNSTSVNAVWQNMSASQTLPVTLTDGDGQSGDGQCSTTSLLSLGAKLLCSVPSSQDMDNVDLTLAGAFEGGKQSKQKVKITKDGTIVGLNEKLQSGKQYKLSIKTPRSLRKTSDVFTAANGATNIPNFILPVGDIFPAAASDGTINSMDKGELNRQWIITGSATGRSGDLNGDGKVNSIDWACMRYGFGRTNDPEPVPGVPQVSPSPSASANSSANPSPSLSANPSPSGSTEPSPSSSVAPVPSSSPVSGYQSSPTPAASPRPSASSGGWSVW